MHILALFSLWGVTLVIAILLDHVPKPAHSLHHRLHCFGFCCVQANVAGTKLYELAELEIEVFLGTVPPTSSTTQEYLLSLPWTPLKVVGIHAANSLVPEFSQGLARQTILNVMVQKMTNNYTSKGLGGWVLQPLSYFTSPQITVHCPPYRRANNCFWSCSYIPPGNAPLI